MKHFTFLSCYAFLAFLLSSCLASNTGNPLFLENDESWSILGDATWSFDSGTLIGSIRSGAGFVITKETYSDFELELEFLPDSSINSGIFVRCLAAEISNTDCYEFNIWDLHPNQDFRTGAVVTRAIPLTYVETIGKWNTYTIRTKGNMIQAWVNGELTADIINNDRVSGYIGLQAAGEGEIKFRNIRIRSLQ
ncbi:3-keto-disaccharide hydrolase [Spongiimicrobium salis]|uniref:3-keto-disaccharide hydrolase n=1 Tax=Spongiimicrobium salis TaxID=1667022 RepID=UPI00374D5BC8